MGRLRVLDGRLPWTDGNLGEGALDQPPARSMRPDATASEPRDQLDERLTQLETGLDRVLEVLELLAALLADEDLELALELPLPPAG